jgi:exopolyphosphatase/guanosine-5'-triphosphate,3'-diphosphate pyrophosphatase
MRVAIIDVGSNTARLLVAARGVRSVTPIHEERALLALGDEIERVGSLSELKLAETAERARAYARKARELGCRSVDVIVSAPGRQSGNAQELLRLLERATGVAPRVLSAEEEGRLAYEGALASARAAPARLAVCDVGGGSTEVVVGTRGEGPDFCRSLDIGSLRLARRFLDDDPPRKKALVAARREVAERFDELDAPRAKAALATGGSARALRKVTGRRKLGERELAAAVSLASTRTSVELAREFSLDPMRARTLLAGALILAETQRRLGVPLEVARGGLREGAALTLLTALAAA